MTPNAFALTVSLAFIRHFFNLFGIYVAASSGTQTGSFPLHFPCETVRYKKCSHSVHSQPEVDRRRTDVALIEPKNFGNMDRRYFHVEFGMTMISLDMPSGSSHRILIGTTEGLASRG